MAGWQDGRMAGWQDGRMAGWQDGSWMDGDVDTCGRVLVRMVGQGLVSRSGYKS